jgi:hypothetical protein
MTALQVRVFLADGRTADPTDPQLRSELADSLARQVRRLPQLKKRGRAA